MQNLPLPSPGSAFGFAIPLQIPNPRSLSPAALAYIGDAVYELYARTYCLSPPQRLQAYHNQVVGLVRAESQAEKLRSLQPYLTPTELEIVRRGRNAASNGPKRVDSGIYQQATSLEALLGYLYLSDPNRLAEILAKIFAIAPPT